MVRKSTLLHAVTVGMVILVVGVLVVSFLGEPLPPSLPPSLPPHQSPPASANPFLLVELYRYLEPLVYALFTLPPFHLVSCLHSHLSALLMPCAQAKAMADIGSAASDTDANGLPQTPYSKTPSLCQWLTCVVLGYTWAHMFQKRKVLILNFGDSSESFSTVGHSIPSFPSALIPFPCSSTCLPLTSRLC